MPRRPTFTPKSTEKGWCVSVPPGMDGQAKRSRRYFAGKTEALSYAARLRSEWLNGNRAGVVPHALALQAAEADQMLAGTGRSVVECVKLLIEVEAILAPTGLQPLDAAKSIAKQFAAAGSNEVFRDRYASFCRTQEAHWRPRYAADMEKIPNWVGRDFMGLKIGQITPDLLRAALVQHGAKSPTTVKARAARVMSVVNGRGKQRRGNRIEIMTMGQCARMLRACADPAERWAVALLLFAGIRPSALDGEITRLDWSDVGEQEIYVSPAASKTGTDRHIPITPRLRRLLKGHPAEGTVIPAWWHRKYPRLRKAAGIGEVIDITRHTFASNFLAAFGEQAAKSAMGHTAGSDTLFRHYRRAVTERDGIAFFGMRPPAKADPEA